MKEYEVTQSDGRKYTTNSTKTALDEQKKAGLIKDYREIKWYEQSYFKNDGGVEK